jgi:hypothetical protein
MQVKHSSESSASRAFKQIKERFSLTICIFAINWLGFFLSGVVGLNPPVLTGVSTNTGNTSPQYLGNDLTSVSSLFFTTSANTSLAAMGYLARGAVHARLRLHVVIDAAKIIDVPLSSTSQVGGLVMKDPLKVFVADLVNYRYVVGYVQNFSGTYTWTQLYTGSSNTLGSVGYVTRSVSISSSNLVLIWGSASNSFAWKYDISLDTTTNSTGSGLQVNYSSLFQPAFNLQVYKSDFIVVSMSNTASIPIIKHSDFSVQYVLNRTDGCNALSSLFDNLNADGLFELWDNSQSTSSPALVYLNIKNYLALQKIFPDLSLPDTIYSNILNFGPYQYLAVITRSSTTADTFSLVYKSNLTATPFLGLDLTPSLHPSSLLGVFAIDKLHYFSFINIDSSLNNNFQSYYLELDRCLTRNPSDSTQCLKCIPPFYRTDENPGNVCLDEPYYPIGQGRNIPLNILSTCHQAPICLKCAPNYLQCTLCDISIPTYLSFRNDQQCYTESQVQTFTGYWGLKVAGGTYGTCATCSSGCVNCTENHDFCVKCDYPSYFLDTVKGLCYNDTTSPVGIGRNVSSNLAVACLVTNCSNCSSDYTICKSCRADLNSFFVTLTGTCLYYLSIPAGFGADRSTNITAACTMTGCYDCRYNRSVCSVCNTTGGYFKNVASGVCTEVSLISSGFGGSFSSGTIVACILSGCSSCQKDNTVCVACDTSQNLFLDVSSQICVIRNNIPLGNGANSQAGIIASCADTNCQNCQNDYRVCQFCKIASYYMLVGTGCISADDSPAGTGLDKTTSMNKVCTHERCLDCKRDNTVCLKCDEVNGYYLEGTSCIYTTASLAIKVNPSKNQLIDASFVITVTLNDLKVPMIDLMQSLMLYLNISRRYVSTSSRIDISIPETFQISYTGRWLILDLKFQSPPADINTELVLSTPGLSLIQQHSNSSNMMKIMGFKNLNYSMSSIFSTSMTSEANYQGKLVGGLVNFGTSASGNSIYQTIVMFAASFDPTGTFMKLNQILKIINKLYFININYGKRLEAFLKAIGLDASKPSTADADRLVRSSKASEGKLSRDYVPLDVNSVLGWKMATFLIVKIYGYIGWILMKSFKLPKILIYTIHYSKKVDVIVLNLFFCDIMWYATHSLSHGRNLPLVTIACAWLSLLIISWELLHVFQLCIFDDAWFSFLRQINHQTKNDFAPGKDSQSNVTVVSASKPKQEETPKKLSLQGFQALEKSHNDHLDNIDHIDTTHHEQLAADRITLSSSRGPNIDGFHSILEPQTESSTHKSSFYHQNKNKVVPAIFTSSMRSIMSKSAQKYETSHQNSLDGMHTSQSSSSEKGKNSPKESKLVNSEIPVLETVNQPKPAEQESKGEQSVGGRRNAYLEQEEEVQDKQINYRETRYSILDCDPQLLKLLASSLNPTAAVYSSRICRTHLWQHMARLAGYQLAVVSTQNIGALAVLVLLLLELTRLTLSVYCYMKYKYLKNIICLLMEVSQSFFLALFLILALLISPKRFDEPVIDFYQDAGIWIVIASCVAEYLLLITYITVAAYEFIKNRKVRNLDSNSVTSEQIIKYGEDEFEKIQYEGVSIKTGQELARLRFNWKGRVAVSKLARIGSCSAQKPKPVHLGAMMSARLIQMANPSKKIPNKKSAFHPLSGFVKANNGIAVKSLRKNSNESIRKFKESHTKDAVNHRFEKSINSEF